MVDIPNLDSKNQSDAPTTITKMTVFQSLYRTFKSFPLLIFNHALFHTTPRKPRTKASIDSLPNETLLEIFSFLELKPYIICHGVSKKWRQLLPSTGLHPIRKRLLDLYHNIVNTPDFEETQEWTGQNLQPFDREEYISCLLKQYPVIPEEFRMWILEWPARLVVHCTWPGLPFVYCRMISPIIRRLGVNWIAYRSFSPQLSSLVYKQRTPSEMYIPGLFIWHDADTTEWLIFEQDEPNLFGRVFLTPDTLHYSGSIPFYPPRSMSVRDDDAYGTDSDTDSEQSSDSVISEGERLLTVFEDWIFYLEYLWDRTSQELRLRRNTYFCDDPQIPYPIRYEFDTRNLAGLPAPAWDSCQRTIAH